MKKISVLVCCSFFLFACSKRKAEKLNESLYDEITTASLISYQGIDSIYPPAGGSPHGNFKLKFNTTAAAALTDNGRLPVGGVFPDGSLIVKEVISGNSISLYAIMKKDKESKFKSEGDWVWGEYSPNGDVVYSVGEKGASCTSCHSSGAVRDWTKSFDLH